MQTNYSNKLFRHIKKILKKIMSNQKVKLKENSYKKILLFLYQKYKIQNMQLRELLKIINEDV